MTRRFTIDDPRRAALRVALLAAALSAAFATAAPNALAHAQLLGTSPESGSTVATQPPEVIFKFNQSVGGTLGAVRVYDAQGNEVDNLDVSHPNGQQSWMGVGLKPQLPDGTYTGTYRVISADTHIVYGGLVFNIGHAGAAPKFSVANLINRNEAGPVTDATFQAVRGLDYVSIALALGGLAFLIVAWLPGLADVAGGDASWSKASEAFARRFQLLMIAAIVLGVVVSVLGILLQGASAAGVSLWSSLKGTVINNTMSSRFGEVWGLRAIDWLALGGLLLGARLLRRDAVPVLRPAALGADGIALAQPPPRWLLALVGVGAAYLAATPALSGHASIQGPRGVFFPSDFLHVLAASVWVGGIACLLFALPGATRELQTGDRARLLTTALARFSPLALAAVVTIAVTGVVQAYIDVRSLHGLFHTTYGLLIVAKVLLLSTLIGLGVVHRRRIIPALARIVTAGVSAGETGVLARRTLRAELVAMMAVFGITSVLISYAPPIDAATGPFSTNTTIGPIELEMTVDPARIGVNTVHIYLINAKDGTQFTKTKELDVTAALPAKGIGPLTLQPNLSGPGHYILNAAVLSPSGTWQFQLTDRVSAFDEYIKTVNVPIH